MARPPRASTSPPALPEHAGTRNPFVIGHHAEGAGFCNRTREVARLAAALADPRARLLAFGDRRLGKSSALHVAAAQVRAAGHAVAVVDLASAASAPAAAQRILAAAHQALSAQLGTRWRDTATRLLARLRPGSFTLSASTDPLTGQPTVSFQVAPARAVQDPAVVTDVLDALEGELTDRDATLGLGLDEFQRLGRWYGDEVAWQLKALLERHRRIGYVLAGSERSLITQMLENRKAGLWKVVDVLPVEPIAPAELMPWLVERAGATGVRLDVIVAAAIVRLAGPRTRDVVQLARATWDLAHAAGGVAARDAAEQAMEALVREQGALHLRQWDMLRDVAQRVLVVLATSPDVPILGADTLTRYSLGPKSTVARALDDLVTAEVLVRLAPAGAGRAAGAGAGYAFDDPFFRRWVEVNAAADLGRRPPRLTGGDPPDLPSGGEPPGNGGLTP